MSLREREREREFGGKKYTSWAFQFQLYLKNKEQWRHIDGSDPKLTADMKDEKGISNWEVKDAQIMSWILGSIDF